MVELAGHKLRRQRDARTGAVVYRPVDDATEKTLTPEEWERRKREEHQRKREAANPQLAAKKDLGFIKQKERELAEKRIAERRALDHAERKQKEKMGLLEKRPQRKNVYVKESAELLRYREEEALARAAGMDKKQPGQFRVIAEALEVEEAKHAEKVKKARDKAYVAARKRAGIDGKVRIGDSDSDPESDDNEGLGPRAGPDSREAALNDPDYARGPAVLPGRGGRGGRGGGVLFSAGTGRGAAAARTRGTLSDGDLSDDEDSRPRGPPRVLADEENDYRRDGTGGRNGKQRSRNRGSKGSGDQQRSQEADAGAQPQPQPAPQSAPKPSQFDAIKAGTMSIEERLATVELADTALEDGSQLDGGDAGRGGRGGRGGGGNRQRKRGGRGGRGRGTEDG